MVSVYIEENGDVSMRCSLCDRTEIITVAEIQGVFGPDKTGILLLLMVEHYRLEALNA